MKNAFKIYLFLIVACLPITNATAQITTEQDTNIEEAAENQHELRLNALYLILGAFELNYEYLLNEDSGIGVTAMYTFDDDLWIYRHHVAGYYRHYFGKKYAGGFYGEAFLMYNSIEDDRFYYNGQISGYEEENSHNLAIGFSFGTKLISKKNLLLDAGLGLGRNIIDNSEDGWIIPRFNISFGYRF